MFDTQISKAMKLKPRMYKNEQYCYTSPIIMEITAWLKHVMFTNICLVSLLILQFPLPAKSQSNPFGNALIPDMIADASIQEINGTFYCYATTDGYDEGLRTSGPAVVWKSTDFVHWSFSGTCFPSAAGQLYWAPSKAISANGKYYLYPTVNGYMYAAVSNSPDGPFRLALGPDTFIKPYSTNTLLKQKTPKGPVGIDADIFIDDNHQAYLFWQLRHAARLSDDMLSSELKIKPAKDTMLHRVEYFIPSFAIDGANGSRWMATPEDTACWIMADLGKITPIKRGDLYFVRPTAGHAYVLESSTDGIHWSLCGGHHDVKIQSPHTDTINIKARFLRTKITTGIKGIWEWNIY